MTLCPFLSAGVDETEKELYLRYSKASDSAELSRATFDFLPRADVWEHVCLVKGGEDGMRLAFYHNGKKKGEGEKDNRFRIFLISRIKVFFQKVKSEIASKSRSVNVASYMRF